MAHTRSGQIRSSFSGSHSRRPEHRNRMAGEQLGEYLSGGGQQVLRGASPNTLFGDYTLPFANAAPGMMDIGAAEQTLL